MILERACMNHYELMAIISGRFADTEVEPVMSAVEGVLKKHDGALHYRQNLERKKLAYPIEHQLYGTYMLAEFDCTPQKLAHIERELKLMREVVRFLIVKKKKVGAPKLLDRRGFLEQEAFGKPGARGKPFGPALTIDQAIAAVTADAQGVQTQEMPQPAERPVVVATQTPDVYEEIPHPAPPVSENADSLEEKVNENKKQQKVTQKVSYEELDKKLDEILKNDIL